MIIDSSAWIAYLRGGESGVVAGVANAVKSRQLLVPDVVLMEVLQGARDSGHFSRLDTLLRRLPRFTPASPQRLAREAAHLYARCRWNGFTPGGANDCLIACCAVEAGRPLLHADGDFVRIAAIEPALRLANLG